MSCLCRKVQQQELCREVLARLRCEQIVLQHRCASVKPTDITSCAIKIIVVVQLVMLRAAWYNVVGSAARLYKKRIELC